MKDVYHNAAFCIAATAAPNGTAGLFYERNPAAISPIRVNLLYAPTSDHGELPYITPCGMYWMRVCPSIKHAVAEAPLNTRAWVSIPRLTTCSL
jgi:hypothetical protein